jgi:chromatin remodeling complex protein RSC6
MAATKQASSSSTQQASTIDAKPVLEEPVIGGVIDSKTDNGLVVAVEEENNPVSIYISKLNNYVERISTMNKELKDLVNVGKSLEKDFNNIVKVMSKKNKKTSTEKRTPSGFAVPYKLSEELYEFLNINKEEKFPRNDVTRMINAYIKTNDLRDEKDKRNIIPNDALHKIFKSTVIDKITYFNLQSYIKHHFIK